MAGVASTGKTGIGALLQVGDGESPMVFATVANVTQLSIGGVTLNMVDSTHLNSPDFYMEQKPGLKKAVDWTGTIQWDPTDPTTGSATGLTKFLEDRSLETFRFNAFQLGITTALEVDANVSSLGNIEVSPEGLMTRPFTLSPSGKVREVTVSSI
ncbi:hypothetical protein NKJ09_22725 [Mesorhizobium sp. M0189]|uniref:phage tail tube protein n=1 Tax=Mesorhizobium sp. M0189 TaxID=2956909 RepID=UPI0033383175